MYSDEEIRSQLQLAEDSTWEFKAIEFGGNRPRSPNREDLADEIAAFANGDGGVLLCGVTDAGDVQGMTREQMVELDSLWSKSAPTPSDRRSGSAPITGNSMISRLFWSKYRRATLNMTVPEEAIFE